MNPEKNNSKADPLLQRALELFEEERPEVRSNCDASIFYIAVHKLLNCFQL
jgi:hypothetical protein